jgi:hypothetical protein
MSREGLFMTVVPIKGWVTASGIALVLNRPKSIRRF